MAEPGKKLDEITSDFESKVNQLKGLFSKEEKFWSEIKNFKSERNKLNVSVSELAAGGKRLRAERDKLNEQVAALKQKRSEFIDKIKKLRDDAKGFSVEKKSLSKDAGGISGKIVFKLNKIFSRLLVDEMPLEREKKLFEDAVELSQKLDIAMKVDEIHSSILSKYSEIAVFEGEINKLSDAIRSTAREAEEKHVESLRIYSELDSVRKQSDDFHHKLISKYEELKPIRDTINGLKDEIKSTEDEMDTVYRTMARSREVSVRKQTEERITEAKERLKNGKRISLDDFRSIIESEGVLSDT
jgi:uncharacterized coiled-coil DUF342 family protein